MVPMVSALEKFHFTVVWSHHFDATSHTSKLFHLSHTEAVQHRRVTLQPRSEAGRSLCENNGTHSNMEVCLPLQSKELYLVE